MVKRIGWMVLVLSLAFVIAADAAQAAGKIAGTVRDAKGQVLPDAKLQLRNIDTGQLVATTRASGEGGYEFTRVLPGDYVVEIVDDADRVVGLGAATDLGAGGSVTGLVAAVSSTGALAGAAAAGELGAFFSSTGGALLLVGIDAGVTAGVIAITNDASPSR